MLELFGVLFITLFIAFLLTLVMLNLDMLFKKGKVEKIETVNPAILELIEMGNEFGSTTVSAPTRKEIDENIRRLFDKQRSINAARKEFNEVQEKYLETLPKHKARIKLRNKRKGKK